jgi:ATP-dependent Clp protease protease subunit
MAEITLPNPKNRNLYLAKQVDQDSINSISKAIIEINQDDEHLKKMYAVYDLEYVPKPIKLYIDSYGGYVYQCFGLLGIMRNSAVPIHTIVTGCAMSCGFLISIAGHKRFGYHKSTYLYHQVSSGSIGKAKDMEEDVIETLRLQSMIEEHTLEYTRISGKKLKKVYKGKLDWFIGTKEALKLKIIDEVI